jgi:3-deoxy-manno-octulosonate cytidylyltransferase (CMP-KDO synthetase)
LTRVTSSEFTIIIPARFASTRFPGKPLVFLRGASGTPKSLIHRSWECASSVPGCTGVWVATDDERIAAEVESFGGKVVFTSEECASGTERCADAIRRLGDVPDLIVNIQGDAPLSPAWVVNQLIGRLQTDDSLAMATPAVRCSPSLYEHLKADEAAGRVGGTTVVFSGQSRALYFSKRLIPYLPPVYAGRGSVPIHLHLGMYAYRTGALRAYAEATSSELENLEGLEQLRFLDLGLPVSVVQIEQLDWDSIELNNPSDVPQIERVLADRGID